MNILSLSAVMGSTMIVMASSMRGFVTTAASVMETRRSVTARTMTVMVKWMRAMMLSILSALEEIFA